MVRALDARSAAEKRLSERGKLDAEVRTAGERAASEARHARYLFERIHAACSDKAPDRLESAVLDWEESVQRTLVAMGLQGSVEAGLSPPLEAIEKEAARLRGERDRLRISTTKRAGAADSLRETSQELREQLRDRDLQIAELRRLQAEPEELERIQGTFRRDEGRVLLDGRDLILRLHGLQFPSGKAQLSADAEPLLDKIVQLVERMPSARLVVEGHTDSAGKPEANQSLSQQRADAVRDALIQKAHLEPGRITAIGYGSSRPVASNDVEEGRALNRRIEIIVTRSQ
jgi:outer membrane protein OmpA-like peptidoglycan-associated protein